MLRRTMQNNRAIYLTEIGRLPTKQDEAYYLLNIKKSRYPLPNPHKYAYFCFACGVYHKDLKHDNTVSHLKNEIVWNKEMGYKVQAEQTKRVLEQKLEENESINFT